MVHNEGKFEKVPGNNFFKLLIKIHTSNANSVEASLKHSQVGKFG